MSFRVEMDNIQKFSCSANAESSASIKRLSDALNEVLSGELPKNMRVTFLSISIILLILYYLISHSEKPKHERCSEMNICNMYPH